MDKELYRPEEDEFNRRMTFEELERIMKDIDSQSEQDEKSHRR